MAQFTNQASISYNGVTANSNIVTGEITQVLTASKTSVSGSYRRSLRAGRCDRSLDRYTGCCRPYRNGQYLIF